MMKPDCIVALLKIIAFFPSVKGRAADEYAEAIYEQCKYIPKDEWDQTCFRMAGQVGDRLPRAQEYKAVHARLKEEMRFAELSAMTPKLDGPITNEQLCAEALALTPLEAKRALAYHERARGPIRPELARILRELADTAPPEEESIAPQPAVPAHVATTDGGRGKGTPASETELAAGTVPLPAALIDTATEEPLGDDPPIEDIPF